MSSNLAAAVAHFGSIKHVLLGDEMGQLVVVRQGAGGPKAFMVNLLRGDDGIWRIEGM